MDIDFISLADDTTSNIFSNVGGYSRPPVVSLKQVEGQSVYSRVVQ